MDKEKEDMIRIIAENEYDACTNDAEWIADALQKEGYGKIIRFADKLYCRIAGHSDYHGDSILSALMVLAEGREIDDITPLDTRIIEKEAVKGFAEKLKAKINEVPKDILTCSLRHQAPELVDDLIKELYGEE